MDTPKIPGVSYQEMANLEPDALEAIHLQAMGSLLDANAPGRVNIVDLAAPNVEEEQMPDDKSNIVTRVLKHFWGEYLGSFYPWCRYYHKHILTQS